MSLTSESSRLLESSKYRVGDLLAIPSDQLHLKDWEYRSRYRLDISLVNSAILHSHRQGVQAMSQTPRLVQMDSTIESSTAFCYAFIIFQVIVLSFGIYLSAIDTWVLV